MPGSVAFANLPTTDSSTGTVRQPSSGSPSFAATSAISALAAAAAAGSRGRKTMPTPALPSSIGADSPADWAHADRIFHGI